MCKGIVSHWNFGDSPIKKHVEISPRCEFVQQEYKKHKRGSFRIKRSPSKRITFDSAVAAPLDRSQKVVESKEDFYESEYNRLITFTGWQTDSSVDGRGLAAAGFYRDNDAIKSVKCFSCFIEIDDWKVGELPMVKHANTSPNCPFVNRLESGDQKMTGAEDKQAKMFVQNDCRQEATDSLPGPKDKQGVSAGNVPKSADPLLKLAWNKNFHRVEKRMESFESWLSDHCQTPEVLAGAGFFSYGEHDQVACFHCGGTLREWEPEDDPMKEHSSNYPNCEWMRRKNAELSTSKKIKTQKDESTGVHLQNGQQNGNTKDLGRIKASVELDAMSSSGGNDTDTPSTPANRRFRITTPQRINRAVRKVITPNRKIKLQIMLDELFDEMFSGADMTAENNRLNSFIDKGWSHANMSTTKMSEAGFCYTGNGDTVVCFSCRGVLSSWKEEDISLEKHKKTFRHCKFAKQKLPRRKPNSNRVCFDSAVVPSDAPADVPAEDTSEVDMVIQRKETKPMGFYKRECNRLMSFQGRPMHGGVDTRQLAAAGFYKDDGFKDSVKCFACFTQSSTWSEGGGPMLRHANVSPNCPFVNQLETGNAKMTEEDTVQALNPSQDVPQPPDHTDTMVQAEDHFFATAKHKNFCREEARTKSFSSWPVDHCQKPELLAAAGFFSCGPEDRVACFHCGGELLDWQAADDPWDEHARNCPECQWVETENCKRRVNKIKRDQGLKEDGDRITSGRQQNKHRKANEEDTKKGGIISKSISEEQNMDPSQRSQSEVELFAEVEMLRDRNLCKICLDEEVEIVFVPCKHLAVCETCADKVAHCPICRGHIDDKFFVFVP